ncbi:MAG: S-methyl-5-thioribose-1-phosphate isomerase [Candidatus Micrarchaeota archaeon]|nr:S-methyl-5-thioribose-1-phosphate isomerase [Candidatus Micrarchaeota archaeon]
MPKARTLDEVAADIKALKVQGARRIARAALEALTGEALRSQAKTTGDLYEELLDAARRLEKTRPTEPMMRNALDDALRYTLTFVRHHPAQGVKELVRALQDHDAQMLRQMDASVQAIARYGAAEIKDGANVLVHCHSSTLIAILKQAQADGKHPRVTCLETRPLFQGRLTARELAAAGIETRLAVDSAAGTHIMESDLVLVGADAITAEGDLINKIGTRTLAQLAFCHSVRFLCAAELYKYDPLTRWGRTEPIEQRDPMEVWGKGRYAREVSPDGRGGAAEEALPIPPGLAVLNPAFDRTPAQMVSAYVTEAGLCPPAQLALWAQRLRQGKAIAPESSR